MSANRYLQDWQEDQILDGEKDIEEVLRIIKVNNWTKCVQDWDKWNEVVEKAKIFKQWSCST